MKIVFFFFLGGFSIPLIVFEKFPIFIIRNFRNDLPKIKSYKGLKLL